MKKVLLGVLAICLVFSTSSASLAAVPAPPVLSLVTEGLDVTAEWTLSPEAQGYILHYAPYPYMGPDTIGSVDIGNVNDISYHLWENVAYYVAITAYNESGESGYSNIEYFIMGPPTPEWVDDDGDGFSER